MPEIKFVREETISTLMTFISMVIKSYIKEVGVPEELHSNCYWAVKKYMRKVLYDHTDPELKLIQNFLRDISHVEYVNAQVARGNYTEVLPTELTGLIKSAIKGYLNYNKIKIKEKYTIEKYTIPIPCPVDPPIIR